MWLGIDFGTSLSSAALIKDGIPMPVKMGANLTSLPSSVFVKDADNLVVGQTAENLRRRDPTRYKREFKLDLGIKVPYQMGGCELLPEQFVTEVLRKLKREAQEQSVNGATLDAAVITVPANYPKNKRELMRQAAAAAGFTRIKLLPEPVAAATYFASRNGAIKDEEIILVYDLGGGTFDAALIQKKGSAYVSLATPVGARCGGVDFDRLIFNKLLNSCGESLQSVLKLKDKTGMAARLIVNDFCRDIKHRLTEEDEVEEPIPLREAAPDEFFIMAREEFNRMIAPMIEDTCKLCRQLVEKASLEWGQVSRVLLVGGSCRIPYVREAVTDALKRPVVRVDDPELAVCLGAAVYAEAEAVKAEKKPAEKTKKKEDAAIPDTVKLVGQAIGTVIGPHKSGATKTEIKTREKKSSKDSSQTAVEIKGPKTRKAGSLKSEETKIPKEPEVPATIVVDLFGSGQYTSLADAVREARPGSKILVQPGTYREGLVLDKQLDIIGEGRVDRIAIETYDAPCITMKTKRATVRGLTLHSRAALNNLKHYAVDIPEGELQLIECDIRSDSNSCVNVVSTAARPTLKSCAIHSGKEVGLLFNHGAGGTVEDCDIFENGFSNVEICNGSSPLLKHCKIHHGIAGVLVHSNGLGELRDCELFYNKLSGIEARDGGKLEVRESRIKGNALYGIYVHKGGGATVRGCQLTDNAGGDWNIAAGCEVKQSGNNEASTSLPEPRMISPEPRKIVATFNAEEAILKLLQASALGSNFYVHPYIPSYKLTNAREVCSVASDEKILGLFDNTLLTGNAKVCTLIGCRGVYSRASFGDYITVLPYFEFKDCHFTQAGAITVATGTGKKVDASGGGYTAQQLADLLTAIKKLFEH
ncbi:MAG: F-box protein 11 [Blastocatellia bacterium]|jgi:molecular chaperone DnaK (HSP70)|nr:F-box protein 11 [Blastocatellia bacterium]